MFLQKFQRSLLYPQSMTVVGHVIGTEDERKDITMSERRANSVKGVLMSRGK